jgi:WD40 repeat protein
LKSLYGQRNVYCVCSLSNGNLAFSDSIYLDSVTRIVNWRTSENIVTIYSFFANCLLELPNQHLASGESDAMVKIWNATSGMLVTTLTGHTGEVVCLIDLANKHLASSSFDRTIRIWDYQNRTCMKTLKGHLQTVFSLALVKSDHNLLLSASLDRTFKIWRLASVLDNQTAIKLEYCKY